MEVHWPCPESLQAYSKTIKNLMESKYQEPWFHILVLKQSTNWSMIVYNVTCNVTLEVEKRWLESINFRVNNLSKSEKILATSILKLNKNSFEKAAVYTLQYKISNRDSLLSFLNNKDQVLKRQIKTAFGESVLHFSSRLEILKKTNESRLS